MSASLRRSVGAGSSVDATSETFCQRFSWSSGRVVANPDIAPLWGNFRVAGHTFGTPPESQKSLESAV